MDAFFESFRWLYDTTGINLTIFYDAFDRKRFIGGFATTIKLAASCILLSVAIGIAGAWLQGSRLRFTRRVIYWYIQFFRNTPPLVQIYFFYFGVGAYSARRTAGAAAGRQRRRGRSSHSRCSPGHSTSRSSAPASKAVPKATVEAAESFGFSRLQAYRYIVLPLAFRVCLPALNNNLVNLVKTTSTGLRDRGAGDCCTLRRRSGPTRINVQEMMDVLLIVLRRPGRNVRIG